MYRTESVFPYADGYYIILPPGLPERFYKGDGENVFTDEYVICFMPGTPEEVKEQLVKDYAEFHKREIELGHY